MRGLVGWLASADVVASLSAPDWPTPQSQPLWLDLKGPCGAQASQAWAAIDYTSGITWRSASVQLGTALRLGGGPGKERSVFTADSREVGTIGWTPSAQGLMVVLG
jgi:hypothetical protein